MAYVPLHLRRDETSKRTPVAPPSSATRPAAAPGPLGRALGTLRLWRRRVQERDALARLTERDLRDMRISPSEVAQEVRKPFWRG